MSWIEIQIQIQIGLDFEFGQIKRDSSASTHMAGIVENILYIMMSLKVIGQIRIKRNFICTVVTAKPGFSKQPYGQLPSVALM